MKKRNQNLFRIAVLGFSLALLHVSVNAAVGEKLAPENGNSKNVFAIQQQKSVSGKVTDIQGEALPGVNVYVKGTTLGVVTALDGTYMLKGVKDSDVLVFSFVGMVDQEIQVNGKSQINVTLAEESIGIEEVVAVGYGSQRKRDITAAITSIGNQQIDKLPTASVSNVLQGKIAGLNITSNTGEPGGGVTVRLRGTGSLNSGSDPLYIIDGVQIQADNMTELNAGG